MSILHLQLSKKLLGIRTIIVVGKVPKRIQKAKSLGADAVVLAKDDHPNDIKSTAEDIYQVTDGIGDANLVVVATSNPRALDLAMKVAGKNCKINIFAVMPKGKKILLDPNWIHYNQISITGSFSSTPLLLQEAAMLANNRRIIDLRKIISHVYKLDKIHEALLATEKYHGLRVVINKF
jgi:L-iditol 2-dehydrogenase